MRILLTGGGSGGHILPNVVLLRTLRAQGVEAFYIGEKGGMEQTLITKEGIPFHGIYAGKMRRYFSLQNIVDWFKVPVGIVQAWVALGNIKPDRIFSKGGYVAIPVVLAGALRGIPIIIHESDVRPGLTTRISARFAKVICVSWEKTLECFPGKNIQLTGVPVREEFLHGDKAKGLEIADFDGKKPVLLVVGGSLGAEALNQFVWKYKQDLLTTFDVIHIAGIGKIPADQKNTSGYTAFEMCGGEYAHLVAAADIILSRAGSTALSEFIAANKKLILVPLPTTGSRGDQFDNAELFVKEHPGMAEVVVQEKLTLEAVLTTADTLRKTTVDKKSSSGETAAERVLEVLLR